MADKPSLDPRYDPAFQRGFDPGAAADAPRPAVVHSPTPITRLTPASSVHESSSARPSVAPPGTGSADAAVAASPPSEVDGLPAQLPLGPAPWRNPFVVALAVIGVLCIAAGVFVLQYATREAEGELLFTQGGYVLLQSLVLAAPLAVFTGVLILSAVLVLFAVHWGRLPHREE